MRDCAADLFFGVAMHASMLQTTMEHTTPGFMSWQDAHTERAVTVRKPQLIICALAGCPHRGPHGGAAAAAEAWRKGLPQRHWLRGLQQH